MFDGEALGDLRDQALHPFHVTPVEGGEFLLCGVVVSELLRLSGAEDLEGFLGAFTGAQGGIAANVDQALGFGVAFLSALLQRLQQAGLKGFPTICFSICWA